MTYYINRIAHIQAIVASYYKLDYEDMFSPVRDAYVCNPRQVAMYLVREICGTPYLELGRRFRRDHSTIINGIKRVEQRLKKQIWLSAELNKIRSRIERETQADRIAA